MAVVRPRAAFDRHRSPGRFAFPNGRETPPLLSIVRATPSELRVFDPMGAGHRQRQPAQLNQPGQLAQWVVTLTNTPAAWKVAWRSVCRASKFLVVRWAPTAPPI